MSILSTFYSPEVVTEPKHKLSESGNYYIPPKGSYNYILLYTNVLYTNVLYTNVLYTNVLLLWSSMYYYYEAALGKTKKSNQLTTKNQQPQLFK